MSSRWACAVAAVASGVGAGVGAAIAVGQGFAALSDTAAGAKTLVDLVHDVKEKLKDPEGKAFIKGAKDLGRPGKSIFDLGAIIGELGSTAAGAPHPLLRELATVQRERVLLLKEVTLHRQMEKEAQLGVDAALAEKDAIGANITLATDFATRLDNREKVETDPVLQALITVRPADARPALGRALPAPCGPRRSTSATISTEAVQHDLGYLHPDQDQLLPLPVQVSRISTQLDARSPKVISWSNLVDSMDGAGQLSQTAMPFWFSTEDPAHLEAFRTQRTFGFSVPVADLFAEDGSQIYEARFDEVTVVLHGARIKSGTGAAVKLMHLGRSSFRRRPDLQNPTGLVVEHVMPPRVLGLNARQLEKSVEAVLVRPTNPGAQPPVGMWGRGIAGDWALTDEKDLDLGGLTRIEIGFGTQALADAGSRVAAREVPRQLRRLEAWPVSLTPRSGCPTPVPRRGWSLYGYGGGVAAVGAGLI